jgi:hypothetical protein
MPPAPKSKPKTTKSESPKSAIPLILNPVANSNQKRLGEDLTTFHDKNLSEGFRMFAVQLTDPKLTIENMKSVQKNVKELEDIANQIDPSTGRRKGGVKPFFRYVSMANGEYKMHGGGFYLYSTWNDTDDVRCKQLPGSEINGKIPLYFRAKNAISKENFSVQWNTVVYFYWKPPEKADKDKHVVIREGGHVIRITGR